MSDTPTVSSSDPIVAAIPVPKKRGFAAMDPEKVKEIARKGGVSAHAQGVAHKWSTEKAREAGKKGGVAPHRVRGRGPRQQSLPTGDAE